MKKIKIKKDLFNRIKEIGSENKVRGITLISLIITIIILIILAGVTLNMLLGKNGIINRTKTAKDENEKATATETINLKITNAQISKYAEEQRMPTLKELADNFCEDNDFQYVQETSKIASLTKITNNNPTSIYTKLKAYPYEFEINSSLQLASIDGVKVASNETPSTEFVKKSDYDALLARVVALENNSGSQSSIPSTSNNYSKEEQVVGTWIDGKYIYRKVFEGSEIHHQQDWQVVDWADVSNLSIENIISSRVIARDIADSYYSMVSYFPISLSTSNTKLNLCPQFNNIYIKKIIIEYTKTTDTATN